MELDLTISGLCKWTLVLSFLTCSSNRLILLTGSVYTIKAPNEAASNNEILVAPGLEYGNDIVYCRYGGKLFPRGPFQMAPCIWCECTPEGRTKCWTETCSNSIQKDPQCIKYDRLPGECCPTCVEYGCHYNGTTYKRGASIETHNVCKKCYCPWNGDSKGEAVCLDIHCPATISCVDPHIPDGKCCPVCPNGPNCWLREHKLIIPAGRQVWVDKCHACYCPQTNKSQPDIFLNTLQKQTATPSAGVSDLPNKLHAICNFQKSYACNEDS